MPATFHDTASSSVLITGLVHAQPIPQVWKISASGNVITQAAAKIHTNFPPAAFDDFSFNSVQGAPDPVSTYQMSASAPTTPSGASAWARQYLSLTAPRDYPVSTGNLWNKAAYAAVGVQFTGVTAGKQQMIDAVQFEIDAAPFTTATTPSAYQPARQLQATIYPDRLNYCTNPSFEVNITNWAKVGYLDAGITLSQDTGSNHFVGTKGLKVALDNTIVPRTPLVAGTTNLLNNPCGDLGDTFAPFDGVDAEIVHTISAANPNHGLHSVRITSVASYGPAPGVTVFPGTGVFPGGDQGFITGPVPVTAGLPYTFSAYVMQDAGGATNYTMHLRWLDISFEPLAFVETSFAEAGSYTRHSVGGTAPSGAVYAEVAVYFLASIGAGYVIDVEGMQLEQASSASAYVLGTRAPTYAAGHARWQGTQHTVTGIIPGEHYVAYARVKKDATVGNVTAVTLAGPSPGDTLPDTGVAAGTNDTQDTIPITGWSLISVPFIATTTSQTILIAVDQDTMPASHGTLNYYVDAVVVENGDTPGLYFDGSSGADYLWETGGTAGLCRSYYYQSRSMKNGIINLLLQEYTAAGTNVGAPVYAVPKIT